VEGRPLRKHLPRVVIVTLIRSQQGWHRRRVCVDGSFCGRPWAESVGSYEGLQSEVEHLLALPENLDHVQ